MTTTKTQTRGNCQCCGRDQAVTRGRIAKHGYTVEQGWFVGVCNGHNYAPMQHDRSVTDKLVADVRSKAAALRQEAEAIRSGSVRPKMVRMGATRNSKEVPYQDAPAWAQQEAVRKAIIAAENRAGAGEAIADELESLATQLHGRPLRDVPVESGPAPVMAGEKRVTARGVVEATLVTRGRVWWKDAKGFQSWTGSAAWRRLPLAA